ncbi:MAG: hypothetical protein AAGD32_18315 [Planctomycetota bacterium]
MQKRKADTLFGALLLGLLGVGIGLLFGMAWASPDPASPGEKIGTQRFMRSVFRNVPNTNDPRIRNIIVYPAVDDPDGQPIYRVTFERYERYREPGVEGVQESWSNQYIDARTPFVAGEGRDFSVVDWLNQMAEQREGLSIAKAWWKEPALNLAVFGAGWGVLGLAVGGVLGRRGVLRMPTLPERAPKPRPKPTPPPPAEPEPTTEEIEEHHRKTRGEFYPVLENEEEQSK